MYTSRNMFLFYTKSWVGYILLQEYFLLLSFLEFPQNVQ